MTARVLAVGTPSLSITSFPISFWTLDYRQFFSKSHVIFSTYLIHRMFFFLRLDCQILLLRFSEFWTC